LFAQPANAASQRFWFMLRDLMRFYTDAPRDAQPVENEEITLGEYLRAQRYGAAFIVDHLLPIAGANWSPLGGEVLSYPASAFIRFQLSHSMLKRKSRPTWRTIRGGSGRYVEKLRQAILGHVRTGTPVRQIRRRPDAIELSGIGSNEIYDQVVIATHADQALKILVDPCPIESAVLRSFRYRSNRGVLHSDAAMMPKLRRAWARWNYLGYRGDLETSCTATHWINPSQAIPEPTPLFVTVNPSGDLNDARVIHEQVYQHPVFDLAALRAQRGMWLTQGVRRTWYCGAYLGSGFHEDAIQLGLHVAEVLGGLQRPWQVENQSNRLPGAPTLGPPS
jgi:predicted NAD/FAD-binding protein